MCECHLDMKLQLNWLNLDDNWIVKQLIVNIIL